MTHLNTPPDDRPVKQMVNEKIERAKLHFWPFVLMVIMIMAFYAASATIPPGWITYWMSAVSLSITAVTALARLNDLGSEFSSKRWQVRRFGLMAVGAASIGLVAEPLIVWFNGHPMIDFPTWREVMLRFGFSLVWITTPHMPPWWRYVSGQYKTIRDAKVAAAIAGGMVGLDPKDDAPIMVHPAPYSAQAGGSLPPDVEEERRHGGDRRDI